MSRIGEIAVASLFFLAQDRVTAAVTRNSFSKVTADLLSMCKVMSLPAVKVAQVTTVYGIPNLS